MRFLREHLSGFQNPGLFLVCRVSGLGCRVSVWGVGLLGCRV